MWFADCHIVRLSARIHTQQWRFHEFPVHFAFAGQRIAWTAPCWRRSRCHSRTSTSRAFWIYTRRVCRISWIRRTPTCRPNDPSRSTIVPVSTSTWRVASTRSRGNVKIFWPVMGGMATIRRRRADISAIITRYAISLESSSFSETYFIGRRDFSWTVE